MQWLESPIPVALLIAATLSASLVPVAWRRRGSPGATPLTILASAVVVWQVGYGLETASVGETAKILWAKVQYVGVVAVSTSWLAVTLHYSGRSEWLAPRHILTLSLVPLATLILVWTNDAHHLVWSDVTLETSGSLVVARYDHGVAFWASGTYFYLLMLGGVMVLGDTTLRSPTLYWRQSTALLLSAVAPWVSNWVFVLRLGPASLIDPTPFAFVVSFVALGWAVTRSRLLDIAPVARKMAFDSMHNGVLVLDASQRIADWNAVASRILDPSSTFQPPPIGLPISQVWPEVPDFVSQPRSEGTDRENVSLRQGGEERTYDVSVSPVFDGRSRLVGHLILLQDSTDRQRAEAERRTLEIKALAQSKLATLGEVATGVAHEINQPLTYINTTIQALQEDLRLNDLRQESAHKRLTESLRQVKRITDIVQHLRTFGRADDVDMKAVQLRDVLNDTMLLLGEHLRHRNIEVERRVDEGLPMVEGNASQLEQVLINLFQNSAYALGDNRKAPKISVDMAAYNDSTVRIVFSDNGTGIAPVHMDRIFEPFFTTRAVGEGTGLGLSIVYGIIQDHRGTISCESEHAKGTTFTITLPTDGRGTA